MQQDLQAVLPRLYECGHLPHDIVQTVLTALTKCTNTKFKFLFQHASNALEHETLDMTFNIVPSKGSKNDLDKDHGIMFKACQLYATLNRSGIWIVKHVRTGVHVVICWSCEGEHHVDDCPKPRNEAKIKQAAKKYEEERHRPKGNSRRGPWPGSDDADAAAGDADVADDSAVAQPADEEDKSPSEDMVSSQKLKLVVEQLEKIESATSDSTSAEMIATMRAALLKGQAEV